VQMHASEIGTIAEAHVLLSLVERGLPVFTQYGGKAPVDLVVWKTGKCYSVSVKSVLKLGRHGVYEAQLKSVRNRKIRMFSPCACDILAVYLHDISKVCFFASTEVKCAASLTLRVSSSNFSSNRLVDDFTSIERVFSILAS